MIDIVRDYLSIGMGSAQAVTTEAASAGRAGFNRAASLVDLPQISATVPASDPRVLVGWGREALAGLRSTDLDAVASRLGLAKKSELHAVRQQMQRLERRLSEVRRER